MGIEREKAGVCYTVERGVITNPGPFQGCAPWVPFFHLAIREGRFDYSAQEGRGAPTVFWFDLSTTNVIDRLEWPELTGIRRIGLWEDSQGHVYERRVPWIGNQPPNATTKGAPFQFGDYVVADKMIEPFRAHEVLVVDRCICIAEVGTRKVWRAFVQAANRAAEGWTDCNDLQPYGGTPPERCAP